MDILACRHVVFSLGSGPGGQGFPHPPTAGRFSIGFWFVFFRQLRFNAEDQL
jgi:hypothetical protein